ncbi:hypothetical protein MMC13_004767 [Lambiella insularis]|nr:hypothetical protein [Lambiella insularis]
MSTDGRPDQDGIRGDLLDEYCQPASTTVLQEDKNEKPRTSEVKALNTALPSRAPALPIWQVAIIVFCLCFALLLSALETSIVATALVSIASNFGDYASANWVVVSYMLTYTGFMIVYARFSDIYGRKSALLTAVAFFGIFSLACGFTQSMKQLIILRAFQGMGASGIYSIVFTSASELVPLAYLGVLSGSIGAVYLSSSILGPILGGAIVHSTTWKWVFWLNVPCTILIFIVLGFLYPSHHPKHTLAQGVLQVDWPGLTLSLAATILLVFALQSAGATYAWQSATIVAPLAVSGVCFVLFVIWQYTLSRFPNLGAPPVFPSRLVRQRVIVASFGTGFLTGFPFMTTLILLPQRFQVVNGLDPLSAGIRMLPLLCFSAVGSGLGAITSKKHNVSFYLLLLGSTLQVLGMGLMSSISVGLEIEARQYTFQMILGTGFGLGLSSLIVVARVEVGAEDAAILLASLTQVRVLAGCIALAIASNLLTSHTTASLSTFLNPSQIASVLQSTATVTDLPQGEMLATRLAFGEAYTFVWQVMTGFSGLGWVVTLGTWKRARDVRGLSEVKAELERREEEANSGEGGVQ